MHTDPISDLLVQLKMGIKARKSKIQIAGSRLKLSIVVLLKTEGYIQDFRIQREKRKGNKPINKFIIIIYLKYCEGNSSINGLKQISKPGLRVYAPANKLPRILNGLGIAIISTNKGLMCAKQAKRFQIGGEVLMYVW
ncbi:SSU ribosomal protein S8p (S15Ae) [[Mycoplasma] cavipharyngis]|uniref:30S ribosomal protein S8 n=1 Tax=[Mycoplasma] cavipharyngis TaxID=92757 RepID=UPI0037038B16